jgi:hypothetical protein
VYFGDEHFVSRVIDRSQRIWFHDGIITGSRCVLEGDVSSFSSCSMWCKGDYVASVLVYSSL